MFRVPRNPLASLSDTGWEENPAGLILYFSVKNHEQK
jgi:hypothetical protein